MRSRHGFGPGHRWPEGEGWPAGSYGPPAEWRGMATRMFRLVGFFAVLAVLVPVAAGVLLATVLGGWTSVAVAAVFWIGLLVVMFVLGRTAWRVARPVRDLVTTTERLAGGDYAARVEGPSPGPVRPLVTALNSMAERLEDADTHRRRLLADIGHELRTPLTVIRGDLEAMVDGVREPDPHQIRALLDDVSVMERLLEDLRTLSTAEAGMLQLHREPTDLGSLVADVVERFGGDATSRGVTLAAELDDAPLEPVEVDPVRFREVVSNLVVNALRATASGETVRAGVTADGDLVRLTVSDTGAGIAADELDLVFDRFHTGRSSDGSGLGLTISRRLVEAHGGTIAIESEVGVGTTVRVELPAT